MSFPVPKEYNMPDITYNNGNVITLPPSLSGDGTGVNLSQLEKDLILTLFSKAAYAENDAGTAYDTLENLWAAPQKEVESITAVYTQSGTVYETDSLDSLKADLVVTANYSDGTSGYVPSSNYTLSGTLTAGTSTITVSYGGKTTTFNVTVAEAAQYAMNDYDNTSVGHSTLTVTNGNHVTITTTENSRSIYVFKNREPAAGYNTGWTVGEYFDIPAGATVETKIKNITYTGNTESGNKFNISTKDSTNATISHSASVNVPATGDGTLSDSTITETLTTTEATTVKAFCFFIYRPVTIEFDLEIRVNGSRYI